MHKALFGFSVAFMTACGDPNPDCQTTCDRLYGDSPGCSITRPNTTQGESIGNCLEYCDKALEKPGEQGNYQPNIRLPNSETPELTNDEQAAAWMDCIEETACENLKENYCAPIW